jgi:pimeloyl-ACP methyl ester carboxylesterase
MANENRQDGIFPFPATTQRLEVETNGIELHVRTCGRGPAVVLVHGFGTTGDMWAPLAAQLAERHTVVVPDIRGLGLSSRPETGYEKATQAADIAGVLDALDLRDADFVSHDIGTTVAFAFATRYPDRMKHWVAAEAPLPGVGPWEQIAQDPRMWQFGFGGPDMERLVSGRERIYLDRFWNELSYEPRWFDEGKRQHYASLYALPGTMRAGFAQFAAFREDAIYNGAFLEQGRLAMPILALGGDAAFGPVMGTIMRCAASNVEDAIIEHCGHWIMEEQPDAAAALVVDFLERKSS